MIRIFPWLGDSLCHPNIDEGVVKALGEYGVVEFQELHRETI